VQVEELKKLQKKQETEFRKLAPVLTSRGVSYKSERKSLQVVDPEYLGICD